MTAIHHKPSRAKRIQATARRLSVVSATSTPRRRLIRSVSPCYELLVNHAEIHSTQSRFVKATSCLLPLLSACVLLGAEPKPPEMRHFEGRVVKRASGQFDVSNGFYCASFPKEKTAALEPYLGKFVDVDFSMTEGGAAFGRWSFDQIQRITVIEETSETFPIAVTIEPIKQVFHSSEPIVAKVTLDNRSKQIQSLAMSSSHAVLSKDYEKVFWLEPDNHYYPTKSYRFEGEPDIGKLNPGGRLVFTIESRHMAEPGEYDLSYVLCLGVRQRYCVSESVHVEVASAPDGDRVVVLKSWLKTAALEQRIKIANELAEMGDRWAADEFLTQLKTGMYLGNGFFYREAYVFAFRHGGEAGERLMMDLIEHDKFQESAQDFIQFAFISKNRLRLLTDLSSCQHAVEMNLQDWVEHPRICDITADVLMQQTRGKMQFPRKGSKVERNEAVARVQSALRTNPQIFDGLKSNEP